MSAHQIKSKINDIVSHIEDENELKACFTALTTIVKGNKRQTTTIIKTNKSPTNKKNITTPSNTRVVTYKLKKNVESHDLSLALLANDLFKNSKPLPEAAILAFDDVLKASALKIPTLPNRL
jgi:hypothetical protein